MRTGCFAGYLGRDAELKTLNSGDSVANFSIAVSIGTKENPATEWVDCSLFGKRADALHSYLRKGSPVTVSGDVGKRIWMGKDGNPAGTITCRVDKLTFGGKSGDSSGSEYASTAPAPAPAANGGGFDDDIPFMLHNNHNG